MEEYYEEYSDCFNMDNWEAPIYVSNRYMNYTDCDVFIDTFIEVLDGELEDFPSYSTVYTNIYEWF